MPCSVRSAKREKWTKARVDRGRPRKTEEDEEEKSRVNENRKIKIRKKVKKEDLSPSTTLTKLSTLRTGDRTENAPTLHPLQ
jgi:hypothetical protein